VVNLREMKILRDIQAALARRFRDGCSYLSHEVRNQLFPQSMLLADLRERHPDSADEYDLMQTANGIVSDILKSVLDMAKWESGDMQVNKKFFLPESVFKSVRSYGVEAVKQWDGAVTFALNDDAVPPKTRIKADSTVLTQILTNLVSNSCKFTKAGRITVAASLDDQTLTVIVADTGRGVAEANLAKILKPFAQTRKASDQATGTGLGLPLTVKMVECGHGGTLVLESPGVGQGCRAIVRIPVEATEDVEVVPAPDPLDALWYDPAAIRTKDVLFCDDGAVNRKVTKKIIQRMGLTLDVRADGSDAVAAVDEGKTYVECQCTRSSV